MSHTDRKKKANKGMATVRASAASKAELRLEKYRRMRGSVNHTIKGTVEERNQESERVLDSFREERTAANALIADER